jgi:hypothetical protein
VSPSTPIDASRFLDACREHAGRDYGRVPPETLEQLFDGLHDPDEFSASTASVLHAARAAVAHRTMTLTVDPLIADVTVFPGDLRATTDLTFNSHVLVLGDLDVDGVITADPAHAILMVAGNVRCRAMHLIRAYLFVTGDVVARDCIYACHYGLAKVGGSITTRLYLTDPSWANLAVDANLDDEPTSANIAAGTVIDIEAPGARETLARLLVDDALGEPKPDFGPGHDDLHELLAKIARGARVFRDP